MNWEIVDRIGIVMGIIAFFPIMWAAYSYIKYNRRLRNSINAAIARAQTHQPVFIELTGKNFIATEAASYLHKQQLTGEILPLIELMQNGVDVRDFNEIEKLKQDILKVKLDVMARSPECVHLFYSGPVVAGIVVGDIFANCKNIYIYHKDDKGYCLVSKI